MLGRRATDLRAGRGGTPPPRVQRYHVHAVPARAAFEIRFPRVEGYTQAIRSRVRVDWSRVPRLVLDPMRIPPEVEQKQVKRLTELKARRDNEAVKKALTRITQTARGTENLMPAIIDAARVYATVGEISDAMREQFGVFDPPVFL